MLFFQSKQKRNCRSANVTRRNYRVKREVTQPSDNNSDLKKQKGKYNVTPCRSSYQAPLSCVDPYIQQMKFLIEHNSNYFQSKVKITDKVRPNQYRFKIPTKTPVTMYKKNFTNKQKDVSVDNLKLNRNNLSEIMKKTTHDENIMLKSTYQNQFGVNKENSKLPKHKICKNKYKENKFVYDDEVPRFLETQNNCFYLNWGGKNSAISLKPSYQTVSTNFPFEAKTVYKNDFQGKSTVPSKIVVPESSFSKLTNTFMVNNTCYSREFSKKQKRPQIQKSYKPKHIPMKKSQIFKGSTQYRSQFLNNRSNSIDFSQQIAKQDLQTLILNL